MKNSLLVLVTVITSGLIGLLAVIFGHPWKQELVQCSVVAKSSRKNSGIALKMNFVLENPGKDRPQLTRARAVAI
jgi:hypothetical protein